MTTFTGDPVTCICGWRGYDSDLVYIPMESIEGENLGDILTCPVCASEHWDYERTDHE